MLQVICDWSFLWTKIRQFIYLALEKRRLEPTLYYCSPLVAFQCVLLKGRPDVALPGLTPCHWLLSALLLAAFTILYPALQPHLPRPNSHANFWFSNKPNPFLYPRLIFAFAWNILPRFPKPVLSNYTCLSKKVTSSEWALWMTLSK